MWKKYHAQSSACLWRWWSARKANYETTSIVSRSFMFSCFNKTQLNETWVPTCAVKIMPFCQLLNNNCQQPWQPSPGNPGNPLPAFMATIKDCPTSWVKKSEEVSHQVFGTNRWFCKWVNTRQKLCHELWVMSCVSKIPKSIILLKNKLRSSSSHSI